MSRQTAYTTISLHRKAKDGKDGQDGKDGINGQDGKDGINGQDGKDGTNGIDGTSPIMLVGAVANVTIATDRSGAASAAGSMEFECRIYDGETPLTCGYELQTTTNLIVTSVASTGIVTVSWKKGDTITEQTISLQVECQKDVKITKTASIKVTPVAVGATGSQGARLNPRGKWQSGLVLTRSDSVIDYCIYVDETDNTDKNIYVVILKSGYTTNSTFATEDPKIGAHQGAYECQQVSGLVASDVILGNSGRIECFGSSKVIISDDGSESNGWVMTNGSIKHGQTNLELTKDGKLNIPSGTMSFKVGSKTYTNISEAVTDGAWRSNTNLLLNPLLNKGFYSGFSKDNATSSTSAVYGITSQSFGGYTASKLSMYDGKICGIYLAAAAAGSTLAYLNYSSALKKIQLKANTSYAFSVWVKSDRTLNGLMCAQIHLWKDATDMSQSSRKHFTLVASNMGETIEGYTQCYFTLNTKTTKDGGTPLNDQYLYFSWIPLFGFTASAAGNSGIMVWAAAKLEEGTQATSIYGPSLLLDTGIDIQNRTIKLTTDNLVCENNSGERTMWLDSMGNLTTAGAQKQLRYIVDTPEKFGYVFIHGANEGIIENDTETQSAINELSYTIGGYTFASLPAVVSSGFTGTAYSGNKSPTKYFSLDMSCGVGVIEMKYLPSSTDILMISLPMFAFTNVNGTTQFINTPMREDGQLRYLTIADYKNMLGRKLYIINQTGQMMYLNNGIRYGTDNIRTLEDGSLAVFEFVLEHDSQQIQTTTTTKRDDGKYYKASAIYYLPKYYWKRLEDDNVIDFTELYMTNKHKVGYMQIQR